MARLRRALSGPIAATAVVLAMGCRRDPSGPEPEAKLDPCYQVDTVFVSDGLTPAFSWSSPCGIGLLEILRVSDTLLIWSVFQVENQVPSPITYGVTPGRASASSPRPLETGTRYRLRLGRAGPPSLGSNVVLVEVFRQQTFDR